MFAKYNKVWESFSFCQPVGLNEIKYFQKSDHDLFPAKMENKMTNIRHPSSAERQI